MMRMCQYIAALESRVGDLERLINDEILDARDVAITDITEPFGSDDFAPTYNDLGDVVSITPTPRKRGRKPKIMEVIADATEQ